MVIRQEGIARPPVASPFSSRASGEKIPPYPYSLSPAAFRAAASGSSKKLDDPIVSNPSPDRPPLDPAASALRRLASRGSGSLNLNTPASPLSSRWLFLLFLLIGGALWWSGMHAIQRHWDPGDSSPFWAPFGLGRSHAKPSGGRYNQRAMLDIASTKNISLYKPGHQLGVCIFTADFWGSPTAGGTATAYHLLAHVLGQDHNLNVTMLGVTRKVDDCQAGVRLNKALKNNIDFACLENSHFLPEVIETQPYEKQSHAVLAWLRENIEKCDVIHGHEWGGAFMQLATLDNHRQLKPGLRLAIEAHGGHFWSTQGQVQRPLDVMSLRIDHGERMTLGLASALISPTHYMTAFLAQRGWRLPKESIVIPNIIPAVEPSESKPGEEKRVWRLAFFSRLEERKGLKMFVDAVNKLTANARLPTERFEVLFVGAEAMIDMRPSREWIAEKTASWNFPVHMNVNVKRDEALDILSREGVLLVLCSMIDNMPYVVAEAATRGIPFLVFDVGGVLEMIDEKLNSESIILRLTTNALFARLDMVLRQGFLQTAQLNERVTTGKDQWLKWHSDLARKRITKLQEEDIELAGQAASHRLGNLIIKKVKIGSSSLEVWSDICLPRTTSDAALLLLPDNYELISPETMSEKLPELLQIALLRDNRVGAFTFGVEHKDRSVGFPGSPTWMLYTMDAKKCNEDIPILMRKQVFCESYFAEARIFRQFHSWILSMLLSQAGWQMHTYPEIVFKVKKYLVEGHSCLPDKPPLDRQLDFNAASNLYSDAEQVMVGVHLAPFPKPISSLTDDFPTEQNHKGWQIGYGIPNSPRLQELRFWPSDSGIGKEGRWACDPNNALPSLSHSLAHPCSGGGTTCCGYASTPIVTRFNSFFTSENAVLIAAYEVWPICGDGLDIEISLSSNGVNGQYKHVFMRQGFEAEKIDNPQRQRVEFRFSVHVGDHIDFTVWPRASHDCDGVYVVDIQIWEHDGLKKVGSKDENSKLKAAAVGGVTEGDSQSFNQASRGEISKDLSSLKANDGALEATSHHQGETDSHSAEAETLLERRRRLLARLSGLQRSQELTQSGSKGQFGNKLYSSVENEAQSKAPNMKLHHGFISVDSPERESKIRSGSSLLYFKDIKTQLAQGLSSINGSANERYNDWWNSLKSQ